MNKVEAFELVLELAQQNSIEPSSQRSLGMIDEMERQREAIRIVTREMHIAGADADKNVAIYLRGNLSDGFTAHGPYPSIDEALYRNEMSMGWAMTLEEGNP